jgi:hypothetical protein
MSTVWRARGTARQLETSRLVQGMGRFGDVCYGVVYIVVAWLALQIALGDNATRADQRGAVTEIAAQPFGSALLWILAIGLIAFGVWQLLAGAAGYRWVTPKRKREIRRLLAVGRAVVVFAIASFTLRLLTGDGSGGPAGGAQPQAWTARLLQLPDGPFLVIVIGLAVLVAAALSARRGLGRRFLRDLDLRSASARTRRWVVWLGTLGYLAKGVAYAVIGVLLITAAVDLDPSAAGGLDTALRTLAAQPLGTALLVAVAIGFAAFGVYCFFDARYRKV